STDATPPTRCRSIARYLPPGCRLPISGVRANTSATSSSVKRMAGSCARDPRADVGAVEADAGLVRDRRQVEARVGRAAGRGDRGGGVLERLARDEVARQWPAVAHDLGGAPARAARPRQA